MGVGNVKSIGVAPDQKLVEVVIKIALEGDVEHSIVTQLRAAGITGIVFVELDRWKPDDQVFLPPRVMKTPYTIIPSKPSQTKQVLSGIDQLMDRITQVDLKGISDQVKQTSRAMETFVAGPEMKNILKNLDSTTASLDRSLRRIDSILADGGIQGILEEARRGLGDARRGLGEARQGLGRNPTGIGRSPTGDRRDAGACRHRQGGDCQHERPSSWPARQIGLSMASTGARGRWLPISSRRPTISVRRSSICGLFWTGCSRIRRI